MSDTSSQFSPSIDIDKRRLLELLIGIERGCTNRASVHTLVKVASTPERGYMLLDAIESEGFLDTDERDDRYAWELTLHAIRTWAVRVIDEGRDKDSAREGTDARADHLRACAVDSQFEYWLRLADKELAGLGEQQRDFETARDILRESGQEELVEAGHVSAEALEGMQAGLDSYLDSMRKPVATK